MVTEKLVCWQQNWLHKKKIFHQIWLLILRISSFSKYKTKGKRWTNAQYMPAYLTTMNLVYSCGDFIKIIIP